MTAIGNRLPVIQFIPAVELRHVKLVAHKTMAIRVQAGGHGIVVGERQGRKDRNKAFSAEARLQHAVDRWRVEYLRIIPAKPIQ